MMNRIDVLVSVNFEAIDCHSEFLENLRSVGLEKIDVLESIGIITGSIEEDKMTELLTIEGVNRVERSQTSQTPPPEAPIQ